jgi:hypothetical protein
VVSSAGEGTLVRIDMSAGTSADMAPTWVPGGRARQDWEDREVRIVDHDQLRRGSAGCVTRSTCIVWIGKRVFCERANPKRGSDSFNGKIRLGPHAAR